jgi:hypothetical protein
MSEQELWQRDCEQAADHHIRTCLEHERRQLAQRLHEAAGGRQDPIRRCLADVLISGTQYLAQLMTSSVARAEDLADDLLRLHHQLRPSDVAEQMDAAAWDECELPQEPVSGKQATTSVAWRMECERQHQHQMLMSTLMRISMRLRHILHELPVDEGAHRQLRASIDQLRDRAKWWAEHPGEAYDADQLIDVLLPIIRQLLEHNLPERERLIMPGGAT